ncbi:asparagine synthase (glutamine-hydrolyzing) [Synechococcus sp. PCC 7335]|uniref:asparagine synthase B n=1 Tax=Synechococcus sp. (strain ATCC 29403 / PCC 7335) TaxID=91464 RepID=UPI00017ED5EC|nr:asparagine synthase B [Synechococcus sp. PCC 7335]EDX87772.1 asparagine synthase (glutamine-hydrolyzing) [Synechococcus sp. PCC 7335]
MCGIASVFGSNASTQYDVSSILSHIVHRGPDDTGVAKGDSWALGHQRLSIVDVAGGHQPMQAVPTQLYSICNGEIYNFRELRSHHFSDYSFQTEADSEILLPLFQQFGKELVQHLEGMYSFVISDGEEWLAGRDCVGVKPLYYGTTDDTIFFASELKALVNCAERIYEFPSGHYYHSQAGLVPYYQLPKTVTFEKDVDTIVGDIRQSLTQSVQKRLMSDVPVGVFLSGGLDSSIVAALMKQQVKELHSFSVGLSHSPDLRAARLVAEHLGTVHHEYVYSEAEMQTVLSDVIYYLESYDPALVRSAIPCYMVSRLASEYVKVVLSGEGADELFAGYSYFAEYDDSMKLHREAIAILQGLHNLNLQRVDRMTMAHSLEGRVPFLDIDFIERCMCIDPQLKLQSPSRPEKWLLRKAFEDLLPQEIVWRDKMEFAQGCASSGLLEHHAKAEISQEALAAAKLQGLPVDTQEELFYYRIFEQHFPHPDAAKVIGRWGGTLH